MKHIKTYEKVKHTNHSNQEDKYIIPLPDEDIKDFYEIIKGCGLKPKLYIVNKYYSKTLKHNMFIYFHNTKNKDLHEIEYFVLNRSMLITDDVNEFGDEIDINLYFDTKKYNL